MWTKVVSALLEGTVLEVAWWNKLLGLRGCDSDVSFVTWKVAMDQNVGIWKVSVFPKRQGTHLPGACLL